jgi:hypothetical protein
MGASAVPRPAYDTRRRLVGVMHGNNGWSINNPTRPPSSNGRAAARAQEPAFRAPWGELERQIPYVTITTQPFPLEWWTPPAMRAAAVTRATELPASPDPAPRPFAIIKIEVADDAEVAEPARLEPRPRPLPASAAQPGPRSVGRQRQRRGFLTRLALVAVGLVISLIAVETASRRRS